MTHQTKHLIIGTAGHIDHGKTSLVRLLTGHDCDTHKEEKQRGITINLGFTHLDLPNGVSAGIIDVPGHKDFINTMIGGACGIDMVLLVIAADSGIMPQTVEHFQIINSLGISKGVVALTRADLVDSELLEMAEYEVRGFLESTSFSDAPIIPVSSFTGEGKEALLKAVSETLDTVESRLPGIVFRMYIDRIFTAKGHGSVVTGSVLNGCLTTGQEVYLLPSGSEKLRVRSIERHGIQVNQVSAGDRAAINLTGIKREDFERGMIICDKPLETTEMIDAVIRLFDTGNELNLWSNVILIAGTFSCQARMHLLNKDLLKAGEEGIVQLHLSKPAVLMNKDRFIIRNSSEDKTLGGGTILETSPLHHRKRTSKLVEELTRLAENIMEGNSISAMVNVLLKKEFRPLTPEEICYGLSMGQEELSKVISEPDSGMKAFSDEQFTVLINSHCHDSYKSKTVKILKDHHLKNPLFTEGLGSIELAGKLGLSKITNGKPYLKFMLDEMLADGTIEVAGGTYIISGHKPDFDKQSLAEIAWLEKEILGFGDSKPVLAEIEEKAIIQRIQKHKIKTYLTWLAVNGKIRFSKSEFIHTDILYYCRDKLVRYLKGKPDGIVINECKEVISGTKKFRALIIEILDNDKVIKVVPGAEESTRILLVN